MKIVLMKTNSIKDSSILSYICDSTANSAFPKENYSIRKVLLATNEIYCMPFSEAKLTCEYTYFLEFYFSSLLPKTHCQ